MAGLRASVATWNATRLSPPPRRWGERESAGLGGRPVAGRLDMTVDGEHETLDEVLVGDRERWQDGPPHELFRDLRSKCPVHWSDRITDYPEEAGFWSLTKADDIHAVSHDWETYSSAHGITALTDAIMPVDLISAMFIGMDP